MRFILLDKVVELVPGKKITAIKALSLAEEYLADHFPRFPVMPGVLMIEAMVQTAAMLVRITNDFAQSIIVLSEARNVKYKNFVKPGDILRLSLEAKVINQQNSSFIAAAFIDDKPAVEARLKLRHFNLAEDDRSLIEFDKKITQEMKNRAQLVGACS